MGNLNLAAVGKTGDVGFSSALAIVPTGNPEPIPKQELPTTLPVSSDPPAHRSITQRKS